MICELCEALINEGNDSPEVGLCNLCYMDTHSFCSCCGLAWIGDSYESLCYDCFLDSVEENE